MSEEIKPFMLVGATVERVNLANDTVGEDHFQWIDSFILKGLDELGGKQYKVTCSTDCEDGYGRMGEADFGIEEIV